MLTKSRAIVLGTLKYGENSLLATLLTEEEGCISFVVKIPKQRRSGGTYRLLQPLALVETEWDMKDAKRDSLFYPRYIRMETPYLDIPLSASKTAVALFLSEFLLKALRGEPPSADMFNYIRNSLLWYDTAREGTANFHLVFLMHLSRFLGFFPNLETYHRGWYFDMENSTFQPIPPAHSHFLHPADASYLPLLLRLTPSSMKTVALSGQERSRLLALIIEYYRLHVADFPELKSLDVLHEVFSQ